MSMQNRTVLIYRFAKNKSKHIKAEGTVAWTMAIRFAIGVVKELIFPPVRWVLMLYAIGEILSYTAFPVFITALQKTMRRKPK